MHQEPGARTQSHETSFHAAEPLISFLSARAGAVFLETDRDVRYLEVIEAAESHGLIRAENSSLIGSLIEVVPVENLKEVVELTFCDGVHPSENRAVRQLFEDEERFQEGGTQDCLNRLAGRIFREVEKTKPGSFNWNDALQAVSRNCALANPNDGTHLLRLSLTEKAKAALSHHRTIAAHNSPKIIEILGTTSVPKILRQLYHSYTPGFFERPVQATDRPMHSELPKDSRILTEAVTTQIGMEKTASGGDRIDAVIYFGGTANSQARSELSHELIEIGLMQHFLRSVRKSQVTPEMVVQYLAEQNVSDLLVWCLQHKFLRGFLDPKSSFSNSDRALVLLFNKIFTRFPAAALLGGSHIITQELALYQGAFKEVQDTLRPVDFQCIVRNMGEAPSKRDKQQYSKILERVFTSFFEKIEIVARRSPHIPLVLHNTDLLLPDKDENRGS